MCAALFITQSCQFDIKCVKRGISELVNENETLFSLIYLIFFIYPFRADKGDDSCSSSDAFLQLARIYLQVCCNCVYWFWKLCVCVRVRVHVFVCACVCACALFLCTCAAYVRLCSSSISLERLNTIYSVLCMTCAQSLYTHTNIYSFLFPLLHAEIARCVAYGGHRHLAALSRRHQQRCAVIFSARRT